MSAESQATPAVLDEMDRARADIYALLARLYYGGPDANLLESIGRVREGPPSTDSSPIETAWQALAEAARASEPVALQQEYDDLFVGTGRAQISPYATYYLTPSGREKLLVELRDELRVMGLSRKQTSLEPEDHFAGIFDVMRHLVARGSTDAALQDQRHFFAKYIEHAYSGFCEEIAQRCKDGFYSRVGVLTRVFLGIETEALYMV